MPHTSPDAGVVGSPGGARPSSRRRSGRRGGLVSLGDLCRRAVRATLSGAQGGSEHMGVAIPTIASALVGSRHDPAPVETCEVNASDVRMSHDRLRMGGSHDRPGSPSSLDRFPVVLLLNITRICPDVVPVQFNRLYLDLGRVVTIDAEGR
jgi:hypothetical protein